jgi:hypothetical protein
MIIELVDVITPGLHGAYLVHIGPRIFAERPEAGGTQPSQETARPSVNIGHTAAQRRNQTISQEGAERAEQERSITEASATSCEKFVLSNRPKPARSGTSAPESSKIL